MTPASLEDDPVSLRRRVEGLIADGLWADASRTAMIGADSYPADAELQRIASGCLCRIGDYPMACAYAAYAVALLPENPEIVLHYGVTLNARGDYRSAIGVLMNAARLSPHQPETYSQLAFAAE